MSYREWLDKADKDLRMARIALREGIPDYAVFHAQQAVEKYIKAFLVKHGKPFGRTHNLRKLIDLCREIDDGFQYLLDIGVDVLYPIGVEASIPWRVRVRRRECQEGYRVS